VREEGLLALALGGIIYAEGNGGTVQEIFQDANQNYYRTYANKKSPMILFGVDYWNPADMCRHNPADKRKKVYPVLEKLACEKSFNDYLPGATPSRSGREATWMTDADGPSGQSCRLNWIDRTFGPTTTDYPCAFVDKEEVVTGLAA
jgi:hypothetical protein